MTKKIFLSIILYSISLIIFLKSYKFNDIYNISIISWEGMNLHALIFFVLIVVFLLPNKINNPLRIVCFMLSLVLVIPGGIIVTLTKPVLSEVSELLAILIILPLVLKIFDKLGKNYSADRLSFRKNKALMLIIALIQIFLLIWFLLGYQNYLQLVGVSDVHNLRIKNSINVGLIDGYMMLYFGFFFPCILLIFGFVNRNIVVIFIALVSVGFFYSFGGARILMIFISSFILMFIFRSRVNYFMTRPDTLTLILSFLILAVVVIDDGNIKNTFEFVIYRLIIIPANALNDYLTLISSYGHVYEILSPNITYASHPLWNNKDIMFGQLLGYGDTTGYNSNFIARYYLYYGFLGPLVGSVILGLYLNMLNVLLDRHSKLTIMMLGFYISLVLVNIPLTTFFISFGGLFLILSLIFERYFLKKPFSINNSSVA